MYYPPVRSYRLSVRHVSVLILMSPGIDHTYGKADWNASVFISHGASCSNVIEFGEGGEYQIGVEIAIIY